MPYTLERFLQRMSISGDEHCQSRIESSAQDFVDLQFLPGAFGVHAIHDSSLSMSTIAFKD
jgi:hypothetical protein